MQDLDDRIWTAWAGARSRDSKIVRWSGKLQSTEGAAGCSMSRSGLFHEELAWAKPLTGSQQRPLTHLGCILTWALGFRV